MFPQTVEINGHFRAIRSLQTDPVNHEHIISADAAIMEVPNEPEYMSDDDPDDSFFNSARKYPENVIGGTLDPFSDSYRYNTDTDSERQPDCISMDSAFTDDSSTQAGDGKRKKRSFNKRILLTVERIDAKVNEFRTELGNQLKSLLDENMRRRGWQNRINMVLTMFATEMAN